MTTADKARNVKEIQTQVLNDAVAYGALLSGMQCSTTLLGIDTEGKGLMVKLGINTCERPNKYIVYIHNDGKTIIKLSQLNTEKQVFCTKLPNTVDSLYNDHKSYQLSNKIGATLSNIFREHIAD
jgi:hypothetical protein